MRELLKRIKNEFKVEKEKGNSPIIIVIYQQILFDRKRGTSEIPTDEEGETIYGNDDDAEFLIQSPNMVIHVYFKQN